MNNGYFNDDFDSIFRRVFQDMQESVNSGTKRYPNCNNKLNTRRTFMQ